MRPGYNRRLSQDYSRIAGVQVEVCQGSRGLSLYYGGQEMMGLLSTGNNSLERSKVRNHFAKVRSGWYKKHFDDTYRAALAEGEARDRDLEKPVEDMGEEIADAAIMIGRGRKSVTL